jgi:DNA repair photolyase
LVHRLRREAVKLKGEIISIANSSDPYPNIEAKTGLMRKCLEILSQQDCKIQLITKSNLVVRDIDLLRKVPSMVSLTITTDNDNIAKLIEPHAPPPSERLKAVKILIEKEIPTSARIDPIIPFVNDNPENLIKTLASIGVKHITSSTYKVKLDNWQRLSKAMPKTAEKLRPFYFEKGEKTGRYIYLQKDLRLKIMKTMSATTQKYNMKFGTCRENLNHLNTAVCDGSWLLKTR